MNYWLPVKKKFVRRVPAAHYIFMHFFSDAQCQACVKLRMGQLAERLIAYPLHPLTSDHQNLIHRINVNILRCTTIMLCIYNAFFQIISPPRFEKFPYGCNWSCNDVIFFFIVVGYYCCVLFIRKWYFERNCAAFLQTKKKYSDIIVIKQINGSLLAKLKKSNPLMLLPFVMYKQLV